MSPLRVDTARKLNEASGILALAVLLDSAVEHYRGSFKNPAMVLPLVVSALTVGINLHGRSDARSTAHGFRRGVGIAATLTGTAGTGFHIYNVLKRPGRLDWQNLFYGAPLGAPAAIILAGILAMSAEGVRTRSPSLDSERIGSSAAGRLLAVVSGLGLIGTAAEAALMHFRGAFHNPAMVAPVTLPPVAGALLLHTAATKQPAHSRLTRWFLRATGVLGFLGTAFHAWGVHRNMGGWRNWRQNVLNGPPLPAPPSFTGLALAGLAALALLGGRRDG
ncbi:MAG TPA: hypothetical protein VFO44_06830 [Steroidobacteraceae bacterium]|nr:hypothetical protein [Steroidobacteraceae bacterium]